ncbi:YceD family protein [Chitinimonas sp. PSY-7]|uniref:YceD family protein n=1 Tax=Chitinimonas sp. PSY-7 TaxID=3459088 RepID=UPI00404019D4
MSELIFDNGQFARQKKVLAGELALSDLPRVAGELLSGGAVGYALVGGTDRLQRLTLDLRLTASFQLKCQRCLTSMPFELDVAARFVLFSDEGKLNEAEAEDVELEGLMFEREFALLDLIEDEILLALPYSPTHEECEADIGVMSEAVVTPQKPNPFAVLADYKAKLKRGDN